MRSYRAIIERYILEFDDCLIDQVTPEHILTFLNRLTRCEARTVSYGHLPSHEIHGLNAVGPFVQRHDFDVTQIALDGIITCSSRSPRGTAWRFRIP